MWQARHWQAVTSSLPVADREYVADQAAAHLKHLAARDGQHFLQEPIGLRWWEPEA